MSHLGGFAGRCNVNRSIGHGVEVGVWVDLTRDATGRLRSLSGFKELGDAHLCQSRAANYWATTDWQVQLASVASCALGWVEAASIRREKPS